MKAVFGRLNANASITSFASFRNDAEEKYIKPLIGDPFFDQLQTYVDSNKNPANANLDKALYQINRALVYYTLLEAAPTQILDFGDEGIMEGSTEGQSSARQWTFNQALNYFSQNADTFAESVLAFLEKNAADYPTWNGSDHRKNARQLFVSSGKMWKELGADIDQPHRFFLRALNSLRRAEDLNIADIIGAELLSALRSQMKDNNLTPKNLDLINKIRPVVAYYALADALPRLSITVSSSGVRVLNDNDGQKSLNIADADMISTRVQEYRNLGMRYEGALRNFLNDNYVEYPLWPKPDQANEMGNRPAWIDNTSKKSFQF